MSYLIKSFRGVLVDIKDKVVRIEAMMSTLRKELQIIQENCPHKNKEGEYDSDSGNWCPDDDSYWISARCLDCGKTFHIDSKRDKNDYYNFDGVIIK